MPDESSCDFPGGQKIGTNKAAINGTPQTQWFGCMDGLRNNLRALFNTRAQKQDVSRMLRGAAEPA
jgi:hypothetical protein